jgi:hypothetical protein
LDAGTWAFAGTKHLGHLLPEISSYFLLSVCNVEPCSPSLSMNWGISFAFLKKNPKFCPLVSIWNCLVIFTA